MFYLILDDIEFDPFDYSSLQENSITIRRKSEQEVEEEGGGLISVGYSGEVTLIGDAYKYVYDKLIAPNGELGKGKANKINVIIEDDCCQEFNQLGEFQRRVVFKGSLVSKNIKWCDGSCEMTVTFEEDFSTESRCIKDIFIWDNKVKFQEKKHPFIWHCTEIRPSFLHYLLFWVAYSLYIIFDTALILISVLTKIPGVNFAFSPLKKLIDKIRNAFREEVIYKITGCSYGHPAPFIRSYLQNICDICGLNLSSSIFNDDASPYSKAMLFYAPVHKGSQTYISWIQDNAPIYTGEEFLQYLRKVFNIDYRVDESNSTLIVERRDYFDQNLSFFYDASDGINDNNDIISLCYNYPENDMPAFAEFKLTPDGLDWCGNEAVRFYEDIVAWNIPYQDFTHFRGSKKYTIPFAPARFRRDGFDNDVISGMTDFLSFFGVSDLFIDETRFDHALLLPLDRCNEFKILIWDGTSPLEIAKVDRIPYTSQYFFNFDSVKEKLMPDATSSDFIYNKDMFYTSIDETNLTLDEMATYKPYISGNMYDRFWYIEDSRKSLVKDIEFELSLIKSCDIVLKLNINGTVLLPGNNYGKVEEITINNDSIIIKGKV